MVVNTTAGILIVADHSDVTTAEIERAPEAVRELYQELVSIEELFFHTCFLTNRSGTFKLG